MRRQLVLGTLWICKLLGLFALARRGMRGRLRILCYHGFTLSDEDRFRPSLFLAPKVFARRLAYLRRKGHPVLSLDEAIERMRAGTLPDHAATITIDDGFYSTWAEATPILASHGFPATLYLTSHYFVAGGPIFQLATSYICWKSPRRHADLSGLGVPALDLLGPVRLDDQTRSRIAELVFAHGSALDDGEARSRLTEHLAERLGVDYAAIREQRLMSLVNPKELREMLAAGIAVELHTHRHRLPTDPADAAREIADNRSAVEPVTGRPMRHFCYPSGFRDERHLPVLRRAGIVSATTCQPGLARSVDDPLALPRILDDSRVAMIEFDAEMSGFGEVIRELRRKMFAKLAPITVSGDWMISASMPVMGI